MRRPGDHLYQLVPRPRQKEPCAVQRRAAEESISLPFPPLGLDQSAGSGGQYVVTPRQPRDDSHDDLVMTNFAFSPLHPFIY